MKVGSALFEKTPSASSGKDLLGFLFVAVGFVLQVASAQHSIWQDIHNSLIFAGFVIFWFRTYLFIPAILVLTGSLIGLGPKTWEIPSVVVMALGLVIGFYSWWKDRQAKALAKR